MSDVLVPGPMAEIFCGRLAVDPVVHLGNTALLVESADRIVSARDTEIAELTPIELCRLIAHDVLQYQGRSPCADGQSVRLDAIVQMIGRDQSAGTRHILDNPRRIAGQIPADVTTQYARVEVEGATGRIADDDGKRFVLVEILRLNR